MESVKCTAINFVIIKLIESVNLGLGNDIKSLGRQKRRHADDDGSNNSHI